MKKLVVGLGNPGKEYVKNRHNAGFILVELLAGDAATWRFDKKYNAQIFEADDVVYLKPQTFMNASGDAVRKVVDFFKVDSAAICVIHDDADIAEGTYKYQFNKPAAGHNGVQDIIDKLGTTEFYRIRVGVSRPPQNAFDLYDWVLKDFSKEEFENLLKLPPQIREDLSKI
jgi:PTH1 family peptidyl-tRNA hydrolase